MLKKPKETKNAEKLDQEKRAKPKYESPKLNKFEKLQKLIVSGE